MNLLQLLLVNALLGDNTEALDKVKSTRHIRFPSGYLHGCCKPPQHTHILNKPIILYFSMIRGILRSKWIITSRVFSSVVLQRKRLKNMALTSDKIQNSSLCFSNNREKSFTSSEQSALCRHHILCFCYKFFVVHFNSNFLAERFSFQQTRGNKLNFKILRVFVKVLLRHVSPWRQLNRNLSSTNCDV